MATRTGRLPGLRFETQPPLPTTTLPRMDVTAFVGFAAAGPLHQPVAIEDPAQFTNVFGQDLRLAWDRERGEVTYAYLGPAVRAFFSNGGRRCWVIRVADTNVTLERSGLLGTRPAARSNRFPVVGLVGLDADAGAWSQAAVAARSEGSWSDGIRVGAELDAEPIAALPFAAADGSVVLAADAHTDLAAGDLVRLTLPVSGHVVFVAVESVASTPPRTASPVEPPAQWGSGPQVWFSTSIPAAIASTGVRARVFDGSLEPVELPLVSSRLDANGSLVLHLAMAGGELPLVGTLIQVDFASSPAQTAWLLVADTLPAASDGSPAQHLATISGTALRWLPQPPNPLPSLSGAWAERLTLDLHARLGVERWPGQANAYPARLSTLGLRAAHPRYWGNLPTDADLFGPSGQSTGLSLEAALLRQEVSVPRFPLASAAEPRLMYLPLGVSGVLDPSVMRGPEPSADTELDRDGLTVFGADLFTDADLASSDVLALLDQADFLRYQQPQPRTLTGMHAVLSLGEPSLVSAPDTVHRGWIKDVGAIGLPAAGLGSPVDGNASQSSAGQFAACDALPAPVLANVQPPHNGSYSVVWSTLGGSAIQYTLEESTADTFADSAVVYRGRSGSTQLEGRSEGTYYYRVRAESNAGVSAWSNSVGVRIGSSITWRMLSTDQFVSSSLEAAHLGLITLSAAAGDLLAVLSLPAHYREDAAIQHGSRLAAQLGYDRDRTLSFGAVYHPWPIGRREAGGDLRQTPPDGTVCGLMAARALARGAWIAPANELLHGVLALTPPLAIERRLDLQEAGVNVLRQAPSGFLMLSANTLSDDETVQPINVRRLMSLLRRLVLREGVNYVFEPNDASFRRLVERGFEALLDDLFMRGAFAGATPDVAFQVNTSGVLNTPRDQDAGRFIVELKVAPARPLQFLTIRLLERGQRELAIVEG